MKPGPGEPVAGPWQVQPFDVFARSLAAAAGNPSSRPRVIAVDGRSAGGKSTLADRLHQTMADSAVVHTDDVAWWQSRFGWEHLMIEGVLLPLHAGQEVHYQPPAWAPRGRTGYIDVPAGASTVIIEGVGSSCRHLAHLIDVAVWVQSDFAEAERRGLLRDARHHGEDPVVTLQNWRDWADEEVPFLLDDRPWERADVVVAGTPPLPHDAETQVVTAPPLTLVGGR